MPTITAMEPQRRKGRLNIFVDSQFVLGVGEQVAADLGLRVGREMSAERLKEVAGAEEVHKATEAALGLLDVRPRATREIQNRLKQKGYEEEIIAQVIEKLRRLDLLNDAQFAQQWVEARSRIGGNRPLGRRRLATELFQKGVAKEQITEAVASVSNEDEMALARAAARKKIQRIPSDSDALRAERHRLMGFLQRRGFSWEIVKTIVAEQLPGSDQIEDDLRLLEE